MCRDSVAAKEGITYLAAEARGARDVNGWGTLSRASSTRPARRTRPGLKFFHKTRIQATNTTGVSFRNLSSKYSSEIKYACEKLLSK
jgi:hypothetical protein